MAPPTLADVVFTLLFLIGMPLLFVLLGFLLFGAIYQAQAPHKTAFKIEQMREKNRMTQEHIRTFVDQTIQKMDHAAEEKMATKAEEHKRKRRVNHADPQKTTSRNEDA